MRLRCGFGDKPSVSARAFFLANLFDRCRVARIYNIMAIGVIDSGIGGLSTLAALKKIMPDERYIYLADYSHAPYGSRSAESVERRMELLGEKACSLGADAVVVACNTATRVSIAHLRRRRPETIFVGLEPALKPALAETCGKVLVLTTPLTADRTDWTRYGEDLSRTVIAPQPELAQTIERELFSSELARAAVKQLSPLLGEAYSAVVLGCTHYCLIRPLIERLFGCRAYDGNDGAARRLYALMKGARLLRGEGGTQIICC